LLPDVPLPFPPAFANELVAKWNAKFQERAKDNQLIKLYRNVNYPVDIDSLDPVDAFVSVVGNTAWECDLVVYCIGVGSENCTAGEYRGPAFWERDDLESPDLGIEGDSARLVISGAGDGALQDLIRAATGAKSVSELMREITREGGEEELRNAIYSGEDRAQRCLLWSSHSWHDHEVLTALEQAYLTIVDEVDGGEAGTVWRSICSKLDSILIARNGDRRTIHLIHSCHHFSRCFGLNRFLAQLTMRRLSRFYPDRFKILTNSAITNVRCNHEKSPSGTCWGKPHTVTFNRQSCGTAAYGDNEEIPSNALILRHGIRFGREDQRSRAARQHLPYGIPY
jgi:hypothetical protein